MFGFGLRLPARKYAVAFTAPRLLRAWGGLPIPGLRGLPMGDCFHVLFLFGACEFKSFNATKMQKAIFKGAWNIVAVEYRERGIWKREAKFGPEEWSIGFLEDGRWLEIFRPEDKKESGRWVFDDRTGHLLTAPETAPELPQHHVFEGTKNRGWLYLYEDAPHIPSDRNLIIVHHSHRRLQMTRQTHKRIRGL
jgi:hypothetical protein